MARRSAAAVRQDPVEEADGLERAHAILERVFGYKAFRSHQQAIIEAMIAGRDVLALMPTGGGKSLCYQIPAMIREGTGIVVSPLIALMQDQVDALKELGVSAAFLNSTVDSHSQRQVEEDLLAGRLDLLYMAPERLLTERSLALLGRARIALFALDEAHCVSQWGHDFRPEYRQLSVLAERFPGVPRIALTATADLRTRAEIVEQLRLGRAEQFVASFDRPNIRYAIAEGGEAVRDRLWRFIDAEHRRSAGIVYCQTRKSVEETAAWLAGKGRIALAYHAGLPAEIRQAHQRRFLREEAVIVVATIAFGMGIDKPDVRFVAHLNLPKSIEAYYQETGRAGRDGEPADAWMVYGLQDIVTLRHWIATSEAGEDQKRVQSAKLDALIGLTELTTCRRQALLAYFGENGAPPCGNCDNCLDPPVTRDGTEAARKALSAIYRTGEGFGVTYVTDVLRGKPDARIIRNGHDKVSTFGIGKELSDPEWRGLFRQLVARGMVEVDLERHGVLRLTPACRPLLRGETRFQIRDQRKPEKARGKRAGAFRIAPADQPLWEALRALRARLAEAANVPPYVIFFDRTIAELVAKRPRALAELEDITGLGVVKIGRHGKAILETIAADRPPELLANKLSDTVNRTLALHLEGLYWQAIAERRRIEAETVLGHFAEAIEAGLLTAEDVLGLEAEELEEITAVFERLGTLESGKLGPAYAALDQRYSYGVLKCVLAGLA